MTTITRNYKPEQLDGLLDDSIYQAINGRKTYCVTLENGGYFISFYNINLDSVNRKGVQVAIYLDENKIILVSEGKEVQNAMNEVCQNQATSQQLINFFNNLISNDIQALEQMEDNITELEDGILVNNKNTKVSFNKIVALRRRALRIKRYYEQLGSIMEDLLDNDGNFFDEKTFTKLKALQRRIDMLLGFVKSLRDEISQLTDIYQSQLDIQQNNLMKLFTVVTTIFMPLTVIVGWYGMNFVGMPELSWKYGYLYVILLSISISIGIYYIFKKKDWLK